MVEKVVLEKKVLSENDKLAAAIRTDLKARKIAALNLVSSPGSGKTSLVEKTIQALGGEINIAIVAGDVQTENDANRIIKAGGKLVRPIITGGACHLDARMITQALSALDLSGVQLLIIENVGNLVCPASYDLGEDMKVVIMSTTEGDDKPLKYPAMYRRSSVVVINKIDLLGTSDFDLPRAKENALKINGDLKIFETSCRDGRGLTQWYDWLRRFVAAAR
ncbi:MAG: hydrogenase nickel incorporation protein HypB [candidate division Zixibacteria bacterium]|nr:hydrogenase nickel incorporation protein HypB [candidate division Zixibacteria bacterium]